MPVTLYGYSERGMVNALCDDIRYGNDGLARLAEFLGQCYFPPFEEEPEPRTKTEPDFTKIKDARLIVEQSFSDFGDLDLLILLEYKDEQKQAILVEAKVSTDTGGWTTIRDHWADFEAHLGGVEGNASSLFVQLYRKLKLIQKVHAPNQALPPDAVSAHWSLGNNRVVRQAADLLAEYRQNPLYLAIVPDCPQVVEQFFTELPRVAPHPYHDHLPAWDVTRWGFITWPDLKAMVQQDPENWPQLNINFSWNEHQIFPIPEQPAEGQQPLQAQVQAGQFRRHGDKIVYVAGPSTRNCRVIPIRGRYGYYPQSYLVSTTELMNSPTAERQCEPQSLHPTPMNDYQWNPPATQDPRPPRREPVPVPPRDVKILEACWETSNVMQVENGQVIGNAFHVFNHHILHNPIE